MSMSTKRRLRLPGRFAGLAALLLTTLWTAVAAGESAPPGGATNPIVKVGAIPGALPTMSIDEIKVGQRGYGLSVFAGQEPERFEVEVIGIMRNSSADLSYVIARLTGKGLERAGIVAGMSGSPVFIDGKLVGAVSFGWPFSHEAVGGITPIDLMRRVPLLGGGGGLAVPPPPVPAADLQTLQTGRIPADLLTRELARLAPETGAILPGASAAVQFATTGFGARSLGLLQKALGGNVAPAGRMAPAGRTAPGSKLLPPGSSVAAMLMDGDLQMAAFGTVTDHYTDAHGENVLAFGHPFLGFGPIRVPMSTAEVVTILSSQYSSFKICNIGDIVGAFEQDRQVAITGRIGAPAPTLPLTLRFASRGGEPPREFKMRVADFPELVPALIGAATIGSLETASRAAGSQSLDVTARFTLPKYGDVTVHQSFDGEDVGAAAGAYLLTIAAYMTRNPFERTTLSGVDVDLVQSPVPRAATLVGATAERTVVRPGETLGVSLDLAAYRGERFLHRLEINLPEDLPAGRYSLLVGDGASIDGARLLLEPSEPVSFRQALALLRSLHSRREALVLGFYDGAGLSVAGEVMPRLPGSVRALWGAASSGSAAPVKATVAQIERAPMPVPIEGMARIDLTVRRQEHLQGKAPGAPAPPTANAGTAAAPAQPVAPARPVGARKP